MSPSVTGSASSLHAEQDSDSLIVLGKVVTMTGEVIDDGAVYCRRGEIEAVRRATDPVPPGFATASKLSTGGVIYPGLIDLHNHLNYNVLPLWNPPTKYGDRSEWRGSPSADRDITVPMKAIIAKGLTPAVIRYVEAKLLVGGTTASQGMSLKSGEADFYRGMVRNFERTGDRNYPEITGQVNDWSGMSSDNQSAMRRRIEAGGRFFHHLGEGRNGNARKAYEDVRDQGVLRPAYVGIHCTGLTGADYAEYARTGAKAVWSPMSNCLLYGETVEVRRFLEAGIPWGFGSDWSPSGTKNLLGEMKVGWLAAQNDGVRLDYRTLVEAVTSRAAEVVGWEGKLGRLKPGYGADLLVVKSTFEDPYENLFRATERDVLLVAIQGIPRYGDEGIMRQSKIPAAKLERCSVGGRARLIYFEHPDAPPPMNELSLRKATQALETGMANLTARSLTSISKSLGFDESSLELDLDMDPPVGSALSTEDEKSWTEGLPAAPLPPLDSVPLDKLTAVDDPDFFNRIEAVKEVPKYLHELRRFYF